LQRNALEIEAQQDIIWARFCALYLPATVDRFLIFPAPTNVTLDIAQELRLNNAYFEMLVAIQHSPYFMKYMRSDRQSAAGGKMLTQALGERLLELAPYIDMLIRHPPTDRPDGYFVDLLGNVIQLLSSLLTIFIKESDRATILSQETKDGLKPWILSWLRRFPREFLAEPCRRTLLAFNQDRRFMEDARAVRRTWKNWNQCGFPSCTSTENLKACGRCVINPICCKFGLLLTLSDPDVKLSVMYAPF
jgi:hypothetical protein